jgi:hypothetical protein
VTPISAPRFSKTKTCSTPGIARQRGRAVGPRLDDEAGALDVELGEGALVLGGEADDLAAAPRRVVHEHAVVRPPGRPGPVNDGNRFSKTTTS